MLAAIHDCEHTRITAMTAMIEEAAAVTQDEAEERSWFGIVETALGDCCQVNGRIEPVERHESALMTNTDDAWPKPWTKAKHGENHWLETLCRSIDYSTFLRPGVPCKGNLDSVQKMFRTRDRNNDVTCDTPIARLDTCFRRCEPPYGWKLHS